MSKSLWKPSIRNYVPLGPALRLTSITPDDNDELTEHVRGLWIGTGGNLAVIAAEDDASQILTNIANGTLLPISAKKVMATGTTASDIVGIL